MNRERWLYLASPGGGALIWALIAAATGRREAWDSGLYFTLGIPAVCLLALACGACAPRRAWRWGALPMAGQFSCMLIAQGPGNLLPLAIVAFAVLSLPGVAAAQLGARLARRLAPPA